MRRTPRSLRLVAPIVLACLVAAPVRAQPSPPPVPAPGVAGAIAQGQATITHVTSGLVQPLGVVHAGDGSDRLFIVEQRGTVRILAGGELEDAFFLDLRTIAGGLSSGGERGLLGIAFHPAFETNRVLFASYTDGTQGDDAGGDVTVTQLVANQAGTSVDVATATPLLEVEHSATDIHSGGQLAFGPDGYLYVFTGDAGVQGDPDRTAQDLDQLVGKTLRIAPDLAGGYTVPADNPYAGPTPGLDEIWASGLRNPWRASFDRATGDLWIADVGYASWEEVNRQVAGAAGGRDYGWSACEGAHPLNDPEAVCAGGELTGPYAEYAHDPQTCAVVGGFVYRGAVFPDLAGQYVLADFCSGELWTLDASAGAPPLVEHRDTSVQFTSFGESEAGELYATDRRGALWRVVAPPFTDVADHSLLDHVMWLANAGISTGCGGGLFCPNAAVSRAQMAAFLARALDLPASGEDFFTDDDGHTLEASINRVAAAGITLGCAAERYCPGTPVTRAEMASFLDRAFDLAPTGEDYFTDDNGSTHEDAINRLRAAGVTGGCSATLYCPRASTTRAQMAAFLHRAMGD